MITLGLDIIQHIFTVGSPFTATVSNNWNLGVTWGNPGNVMGTDYPGLANDVFTINAGVVVKYNLNNANELGNGTVNGTLWFPLNATTLLAFANTNLTIGATGSLFTSSDGTVGNIGNVDVAQTCTITFNPAADNSKGIVITDGAYIQMRGNSALYGGTHSTTLFANWGAGQTFTATGAAPMSWTNGQTFTIARNTGTGVATTLRYTIANRVPNGVNTDITIVEAAPGIAFVAGGNIEYEERNVLIRKVTALLPTMAIVYANRPSITDNHITGTVIWRNVRFTGVYRYVGGGLQTGGTFEISDCIFRNGYNGIYNVKFCAISSNACSMAGNGYAVFTSCTLTSCNSYSNTSNNVSSLLYCTLTSCKSYSCATSGFYNLTYCILTSCNSYSCVNYGFYNLISALLQDCTIYNNGSGFSGFFNMIGGSIGWNGAVSAPNTIDLDYSCEIRLRNVKVPLAGYIFANRNTPDFMGNILCEDYNQVPQSWRNYKGFSDITKTASPAGFRSANCLMVEPLSNIAIALPANIYNWFNNGIALYLPASSVKISVFVYGENWVVFPTNAQLYLAVDYLAGASATRTPVQSVQVIAANNTVTELSVTIVPAQAGIAYARMFFAKYETNSTHRIKIDSVIGINDGVSDIFEYCDDGFKPIWNGRNIIREY
jgi:hypothetical protein